MMRNVPPLWRDVDAYNQLTLDPLVSAFWGHGPAYGYLAKIPLLLDAQLERLRGKPALPGAADTVNPRLADSAIWLLIGGQHLGLVIAALFFITTIAASFWCRLGLALAWASNALFYTFAHCVGSESLSVIILVVLVTQGLRHARGPGAAEWPQWYLFGIALCLCLLTRQINGLFILLLPLAFVLAWLLRKSAWRSRVTPERHLCCDVLVAAAIGLACVLVAGSLIRNLSSKTRFRPHSRLGYTFLWRLPFLDTVPASSRMVLLSKVAHRAHSNEARQLVLLLQRVYDEGGEPTPASFMQRAIALLYASEPVVPWEKLDRALNEMAFAFLVPPTPELIQAAALDFATARKMPTTDIVDHLFEMTGYFFDHQDEMPACAGLLTFRNYNTQTINRIPSDRPYFHLWGGLTYNYAIVIWLASLLGLIAVGRLKRVDIAPVLAFGIAVTGLGVLVVATNCFLGESLPRYALPMWQMLLLSSYLVIGTAVDLVGAANSKTIATTTGE
jgi:hypothetical protein